jgi:erythritol transport system ATP-binding protein
MSNLDQDVIVEGRRVTKRYPGTIALDAVDFRVFRNQINVLIGENGAGKSTLMRILAGVEAPDDGELLLNGAKVAFRSPREAAQHGIAIVYQELSVLPNLDLADNIFIGRELRRTGIFVDRPLEERRSADALNRLHKAIAIRSHAGYLPLGCRQILEVARALDHKAKILILDEPTSALSNAEAESLFEVLYELKSAGVTIIYISHRLNELLRLGDRFTVLRSGRVVGEAPRSEVTREWIVQRMSGRDCASPTPRQAAAVPVALFEVERLTLARGSDASAQQAPLKEVSFAVRKGEILGIYGLLGAGRTELLEALAGFRPIASGAIRLAGRFLRIRSVRDAIRAGIHLVPEDRQRDGLIPELSVRENVALAAGKGVFLHSEEEIQRVHRLIGELKIRTSNLDSPIAALSGGNQQKVLIARCLMQSPALLLLDEPTRGVDVGAKAEIYDILRRLAQQGMGVVFSSSEMEEMQSLSDRALVLSQGRIAATLERSQLSDDALFAAASPISSESAVSLGAMSA